MKSHSAQRYTIPGMIIILVLTDGADPKNLAFATTKNQFDFITIKEQELNNRYHLANIPNQNGSKNSLTNFVFTIQSRYFLINLILLQRGLVSGQLAMKKIRENGETYDGAIQEFTKNVSIKRVETIERDKNLNIKFGPPDLKTQSDFNNGILSVDYIKVPNVESTHGKT